VPAAHRDPADHGHDDDRQQGERQDDSASRNVQGTGQTGQGSSPLTTAEIAYAEAEKALATRAAYASDWRDFAAWCASRGATALPAHVGIVAAYLSGLADSGRKSSTIGRRAAAIGYHGVT
jgi:hypothetical protein